MGDGIQKCHFPKTSSSLTSHLSGLITVQLMPWFSPHIFSFPVLFLLFEVIWSFSTVEEQAALFYLLKAHVLLVPVATLPTNSKKSHFVGVVI